MVKKSTPVNLGKLNWIRKVFFLKPFVQTLAVNKVKKQLGKTPFKTTKKANGDVVFELD
jgi:hypothetical protein